MNLRYGGWSISRNRRSAPDHPFPSGTNVDKSGGGKVNGLAAELTIGKRFPLDGGVKAAIAWPWASFLRGGWRARIAGSVKCMTFERTES